jgi:hypothetical protein
MNADSLIQELAVQIYDEPLSVIRSETDYPNLSNPLHLVVLLIDCNTEIEMNGVLGFLENMTGQHLPETTEALRVIGSPKCASLFSSIQVCMRRHGVSWEQLRGDFDGATEFQITSFREMHGDRLSPFVKEVGELTRHFSLFNAHDSPEDAYSALCRYLDGRLDELRQEIDKRRVAIR